jgi:hypothetical protein
MLGEGLHPDVPFDAYLGNCCPGPSVSGSTLFRLHDECPAKALASHYLSPWPREDDDTEDKSFGTAAHCYLIEGKEVFAERYAVKPEDMTFSTKEGKAWRAENADKTIVSFRDVERLAGMAIGLSTNEGTAHAFEGGAAEVTGIAKDAETGLWLKVRPDYLRPKLAINYKTTRSAAREAWTRQAWNLGYCVSAALCVDVLAQLGQPLHYAFITQEKTVPYLAVARVLSDDHLQAGRMIYRRALRTFADCVASGKWPGYSEGVETIPYPAWAERILADINSPL